MIARASWAIALHMAFASAAMAQSPQPTVGEALPVIASSAIDMELSRFASKARVGTQDDERLLEEALLAEHQGDGLTAAALLGRACPADTRDLRCLEAMTVLYARHGDRAAAASAARGLINLGSPQQALGAAGILAAAMGQEEALEAMLAKQAASPHKKVAEWIAPAALSLGQWAPAVLVAEAELARGAQSWRLSLSAAVGLAQLDRAEEAQSRLAEASGAGASGEALSSAKRAVDSALARAASAKAKPRSEP